MVVQSSLPGCPPELHTEARSLSSAVQANGIVDEQDIFSAFDELCPACHVAVPLLNITSAMCTNGHVWGTPSLWQHNITN
jgi:general transcription factor 3C polypeptide 4